MPTEKDKGWRVVLAPPPNRLAGIGSALRRAFLIDAAGRSLEAFADLLGRLNRNGAPPPGKSGKKRKPRDRP